MERYVLGGRDKDTMSPEELRVLKDDVRNRLLGTASIMTYDRARFGKYIEGIHLLVFKEGVNKSWDVSEVASVWEEAKFNIRSWKVDGGPLGKWESCSDVMLLVTRMMVLLKMYWRHWMYLMLP